MIENDAFVNIPADEELSLLEGIALKEAVGRRKKEDMVVHIEIWGEFKD